MGQDLKYGAIYHLPVGEQESQLLGHDGEPLFVIRGQDVLALDVIDSYFDEAAANGADIEKHRDEVLKEFDLWRNTHGTKIPD
jgi:hypothetical protein